MRQVFNPCTGQGGIGGNQAVNLKLHQLLTDKDNRLFVQIWCNFQHHWHVMTMLVSQLALAIFERFKQMTQGIAAL